MERPYYLGKNIARFLCKANFKGMCRNIFFWKNIHLWSEERRERRKRVERGAAQRGSVTENVENKMKMKKKEKLIVFA